ncbi:MAG: hypothetical protein JXL84_20175 [Deltaproteobacteria bacterium]|nr:hypothetical protein [Deltaproteobacteria bacterium]
MLNELRVLHGIRDLRRHDSPPPKPSFSEMICLARPIRTRGALEIGHNGSSEIACTEAAKGGIIVFLEKRRPEFKR